LTDASLRLAAVDLGAESGRVVSGNFDGEQVRVEVAHRFANRPLWLPDGLHWNLPSLFVETLNGLRAAADAGPLASIGVDTWGCDYALLDADGRMLGLPFHYRDDRTSVDVVEAAHAVVSRDELYARTGIQTMPINTVFQLYSERQSPALGLADRIALIPDLFGYWLTGAFANELTAASTTGMLDAVSHGWATDLIARLGIEPHPFRGEMTTPGARLGEVLPRHQTSAGTAVGAPVHAVGGHDTASAFVAAPLEGPGAAVLSSGTWSLLGVELPEPALGAEAAAYNLTNELGVDGGVRLLRNVMGLWLVQECRRAWEDAGQARDYAELQALAVRARPDVPLFDPDDPSLLHRGDMPALIARLCRAGGQPAPLSPGELLRSILTSLACKYRLVLERLERVSGRQIEVIHVVGGGVRNELLCQLTADLTGRLVLAGPAEATALGNVLVQAMALGQLDGLAQARAVSLASVAPVRYEPRDAAAPETYQRFLAITGLARTQPTTATV
jgi:rhamnulokinase